MRNDATNSYFQYPQSVGSALTCQGDTQNLITTDRLHVSTKISEDESSVVRLTELDVGIKENYSSQIIQDVKQRQSLDQAFKKNAFYFLSFTPLKSTPLKHKDLLCI